jgi:UDP-glucose 4-epimerase
MGRYLLTGAAGFIGSHLAESLLAQGHEVVGVDCFTPYYPHALKEANVALAREQPGFALHDVDLVEADLGALLEGVDGVFHLAAQAGVRSSWGADFSTYVHHNVLATQRVFEAAVPRGLKVVFASSSSIYGNAASYPVREDDRPAPLSPYGVTKIGCEHLARAYRASLGLDFAALRYFTIYGPRQRPDMAMARIVYALVDGEPFEVYGDGQQSREFTFVADAVAATIAALDAPAGAVYNVGGGAETTLNAVIETCERLSGKTLKRVQVPAATGDPRRTGADTSRIRDDLGWQPTTTVKQGLAAHLRYAEETAEARRGERWAASSR